MTTTSDLIILNYADYLSLKRQLKADNLDLCYMMQSGNPVRIKWSLDMLARADFLAQVTRRRPADPTYRLASVWQLKPATWFQPDRFLVAFHSVKSQREADLQRYLSEHNVRSSTQAPREMLAKAS